MARTWKIILVREELTRKTGNMPGSKTALYAIGVIKKVQKDGKIPKVIEGALSKKSVKVADLYGCSHPNAQESKHT